MQTLNTLTHAQQRKNAQHYERSCDFMCMFEADSFDEEVETDVAWMGFVRDDSTGMLELAAEFVYDEGEDSGAGWWL